MHIHIIILIFLMRRIYLNEIKNTSFHTQTQKKKKLPDFSHSFLFFLFFYIHYFVLQNLMIYILYSQKSIKNI
jgi:hypothetical protein